jgi:hypothetical protein
VQWSAATYSVNENAGSVTLTVTRTGNNGQQAIVHFATSNGSASASDYSGASGDVTFAAGETSKPVVITILDDTASEGDETFSATLNAVAGAAVGTPQTTTVTIVDNERAATPTPTPAPTPTATPTATPTPTPAATPAQALNISTRMRVDVGDKSMIGGFIITGNASKPVIIRGMGSSLTASNIAADQVLADPVLELRGSNGSLIASNDNWVDSPQRSQIEGTAFQPTDDREAVILATLPPGAYTAILTGKNQTSGIGLVEVYDSGQGADSALANISTRGFVMGQDNVMIGGFMLGNNSTSTRIAIRGVGASLANFGLSNVLADPTLELRDGNGTLLIANDNWQDDPVSAAQLTAYGLAPQNNLESGIFTMLPPGAFTVILAGNAPGTGIGLVEIYNLK